MRVIGLIGGMSWESTAVYYALMNREVGRRLGGLHSAHLLLHSVDFAPVAQAQHQGDWDAAATMLVDSARRLAAGGAQALVLCTNTMHKLADAIESSCALPLLHIADSTGRAAQALGCRKVGLLATGFTMREPFLKDRLAARHGLEVLVPPADTQAEVHRVIYEELCKGVIRDSSREIYRQAIDALRARGAEAVVLGCTEITLLVREQDSSLPLLDSTALHARAAVDFALAGG
ncbi:MAG TPA: aspartate/glutamate racemase family protein [Ramlibacter sp.]|jgi:aspartate racemase|uniref:aspartate/glutamate racemase family protein n=1 Tax=Ramlibacter sp. TaxID=1917967 RepID=UPI002D6B3254|nr:aspartate/glutamate racemase family protein [Ramlibacter sp.]HZY17761.1 aspartate/glutamate racemase family protein [Ramlibacter sp.]